MDGLEDECFLLTQFSWAFKTVSFREGTFWEFFPNLKYIEYGFSILGKLSFQMLVRMDNDPNTTCTSFFKHTES